MLVLTFIQVLVCPSAFCPGIYKVNLKKKVSNVKVMSTVHITLFSY